MTTESYLWSLVGRPDLTRIWTSDYLMTLEREWWLAVLEGQLEASPVLAPPEAVEASRKATERVPVDAYDRAIQREYITKHDIKARLEIFCEDAGHEYHHLGLTSADVVENTMQIRVNRSLEVLGLQEAARGVPLRGIQGAVGTQLDQIDLLGSGEAVDILNRSLADQFGFDRVAESVGQVAWRSMDGMWMSQVLVQVAARAPSGAPLALLHGYLQMATSYSGDTWNEGDVMSSSVRRVCIPGFLAATAVCLDWNPDLHV